VLEDLVDNFIEKGLVAEAVTMAAETVVLAYLHSEQAVK